jgi:hypothetical protein
MSAFIVVAYLALVGAVALGQWIDRHTTGPLMDEWRDRW